MKATIKMENENIPKTIINTIHQTPYAGITIGEYEILNLRIDPVELIRNNPM